MIAYQCGVLTILQLTSMLSMISAWVFSNQTILSQISLYSDMIIGYFSVMMLYPLISNQILSRLHRNYWRRIFSTIRIAALVGVAALLSTVTAASLIYTSQMNRSLVKKVGYVDSEVETYQMLVNRVFYIFPTGSLICYGVLFLHMRLRKPEHAASSRFEGKRTQKVFVQLLITVIIYGTTCVLFEVINHLHHSSIVFEVIPLGLVISTMNFIPEISLPTLLIIPNSQFKNTFSSLLPSRSTTHNSVAPIV